MMNKFWKSKELKDFTDDEWELLCDGCGRCCFRKIIDGWLWWKRILNTRIACDLLDCETCRCKDYKNRFKKQPECIKLNRKKIREFKWLPKTCAYRLIHEGKDLPEWHPLVSGNPESVKKSGVIISDAVNENTVSDADWYDYVID